MTIHYQFDSVVYLQNDSAQPTLSAYLAQLEEEGFAIQSDEGMAISWDDLYRLLAHPDHQTSLPLLQLPELATFRPVLSSRGALSDSDFSIYGDGWRAMDGGRIAEQMNRTGGLLEAGEKRWLLPEAVWRSLEAVKTYARLPNTEKTRERNFREWSRIRALAKQAGAVFDNFLDKTVVITPESLEIKLHHVNVGHVPVVEVAPSFQDAPDNWLATFDNGNTALNRYDLPTAAGGIVHVVVEPEVQRVLAEIKRIPGRKIAGDRAQSFLRNPYGVLGGEAAKVILPQQFEAARAEAGVVFFRFRLDVFRDNGRIVHVTVIIEPENDDSGLTNSVTLPTPAKFEAFLDALGQNIGANKPCFTWKDYELELRPHAAEELELGRSWLVEWTRARVLVSAEEVYDLTRYAPRVERIGDAKPIYSPYIVREGNRGGWLPDNIEVGITFRPDGSDQTVLLPISQGDQVAFAKALAEAQAAGQAEFRWPGLPVPISIDEAQSLKADIDTALGDIKEDKWKDGPPQRRPDDEDKSKPRPRAPTLCIAHNIEAVDYAEQRQAVLTNQGRPPALPSSLLREVKLLDHQHDGVAWLRHLWQHSPGYARGCLLADDMGLGKTLQLLTFLAGIFETSPELPPAMIVAPVALLDNWEREIKRFFAPDTFRIQTLYGKELSSRRVSNREIDEQLIDDGLKRFLRPDWRAKSNLVLTTYETLRDYEFSLARESWSVMICDEAQKIKSPAALVTQAAKSMNARFKIAATGTPVENSLTDLWCLFDFIQPGLLGALNDFGRKYKRPIEAKTDQEKAALEELKVLFAPQLLRRTKKEVATDLPEKIEDSGCRAIQISSEQRRLYAELLAAYKTKIAEVDSKRVGQTMLGLLHRLRILCAHPVSMGMSADLSRPLHEAILVSPKLGWLLATLESIRQRNEKVIIFTELRDIQRVLQHYIGEQFGARPVIVNGDTDARSDKAISRQKLIDAFQHAEGFGVIILSTQAVGFGLNIQSANHVIHYTRPWNPAKEDQATDRAYRIGQQKPVTVYYPTIHADYDTFEERLDKLLTIKRELASKTWLNGADELSVADFGNISGENGLLVFSEYPIGTDELSSIEGDVLEILCALLWEKQGFRTYRTPASGDGGIDVVALKDDSGVLIQCKASSRDGHFLGWEAVRDVVGGGQAYRLKHSGVIFQKVAVTNQSFNETTRGQAALNAVELYDRTALLDLLDRFPVSHSEFRLAISLCLPRSR